jgi:hypothetical protein
MGPETETCRISTKLPIVSTKNLKTAALLNSHSRTPFENPEFHTRKVFRNADAVCFDVDSTVCQVSIIFGAIQFWGYNDVKKI